MHLPYSRLIVVRKCATLFLLLLLLQSCVEEQQISSVDQVNWGKRTVSKLPVDSLSNSGTTYLSVYSQIYSQTEHRTYDLTATVGIRNTSMSDTLYLKKAEYFNTKGDRLRNYIVNPVFVAPMETVEIIIDEKDQEGGTGANFIFEWSKLEDSSDPIFEAVMISTSGQQGISFTTTGKLISEL